MKKMSVSLAVGEYLPTGWGAGVEEQLWLD